MGSRPMKLTSSEDAVKLVKDKDTVIADGITFGAPEELFIALEKSFLDTGHPRDLEIVAPGGTGDTRGRGFDHFAHEGFIRGYYGSYLNLTRKLGTMVSEEKIEGYMFPLGVCCQMLREIAAQRPGLITHLGLKTFADPRLEGGKLNSISKENRVEVISLGGKEWLFYKPYRIDVALIRGTTADEFGNLTMEKEAGIMSVLSMAQAAKNCGGKVIAQVERTATRGTLHPKDVRVPGILVDTIVIAKPENHMQTWKIQYDPALSGEVHAPGAGYGVIELDHRKVIGRRALMELSPGKVVNLGGGMSEFVSSVAWEEGIGEQVIFTVEAGMTGGVPGYGLNFNTASNPEAIIDMPSQLDFYDGGGIDVTYVGFAQIDKYGNVNASKLGNRITGVGGFLDVAPNAKRRVHCGAFTAGDFNIEVGEGKLNIRRDGRVKKFVGQVDQVTVSGECTLEKGQPVLIITERAVFEWTRDGLVLTEIAPGVDIKRHILDQMEFEPLVSPDLREMPKEIFIDLPLNLKKRHPWREYERI